ncbi:unnamed protein product [Paramecium sonneborni]|uniref:Uncharacterized protein n=1 Tax=Paramecium sonneborni TaxID=65129 RepID=A0A8S1QVZ9_9CILI|nr:unnamed protein product [Paramecium sonneborni]
MRKQVDAQCIMFKTAQTSQGLSIEWKLNINLLNKKQRVQQINYQYAKVQGQKRDKEQKDLAKQMLQIEEDKAKILKEYEEINQQRYGKQKQKQ